MADNDQTQQQRVPLDSPPPEEFAEDIGARVRVVSLRTGRTGTIPAAELDRALSSGRFRLATEDEHQAARDARRLEALGDDPFAVGATVAREALDTLAPGGVSDIDREQGEVAAAHAEALRQANPGAALIGTLAGGVAQGALVGGAGALLTGGRALGAGGRALLAAGEGAVEGAAMGLTEASQQGARDGRLTAEALLEHVGTGTILGIGGGLAADGALGLLRHAGRTGRRAGASARRATPTVSREAVESIAERALGRRPEPGVVDALLERIGRASSAGLDDDAAEAVLTGLSRTEEGRAFRAALGQSVDTEGIGRRLRQQLDDLAQVSDAAGDFAQGELKRSRIRKLVSADALARRDEIADEAGGLLEAVRRTADDLEGEAALVGAGRRAREMREIADQFETEFREALARGDRDGVADAFIAMDRAKRRLGRIVATAHRSRTGLQEYAETLNGLYEGFRQHLENRSLYGRAADAQREINGVWSQLIPRQKRFDRAFRTDAGAQEGFRALRTVDPAKLDSYLGVTGTARADLLDETLERTVELEREFADVVRKHYDLPEDVSRAADRMQEVTREIQSTLGDVRKKVRVKNQWNDIVAQLAERDGAIGALGSAGGLGVAGALIGGPLGAIAGAGIGMLRRPDRLIRTMATLETVAQRVDSRIGAAVRGLIQGGGKGGRSIVRRGARAGRGRGGAAARRALRSMGARFDAIVERVQQWQDDPEGEVDRLAESTRQIAQAAPEVSTYVAEAAMRAASYLARHIPPGATPVPSVIPDRSAPHERVSRTEMDAFLRRADVVESPLVALDEAAAGTITMEHVDALREVYPSIHDEIVRRTTGELAEADEPPPYDRRVSISLLIGVPTDPSVAPSYIARSQAQYEQQQDDEPPGGRVVTPGTAKPPEVASLTQSRAQQLASRV